jgi:lipid A disaccharide synthetase
VTELIQSGLTPETLTQELKRIVGETPFRSQQLADYDLLKKELGGEGASALTARLMLKTLNDHSRG